MKSVPKKPSPRETRPVDPATLAAASAFGAPHAALENVQPVAAQLPNAGPTLGHEPSHAGGTTSHHSFPSLSNNPGQVEWAAAAHADSARAKAAILPAAQVERQKAANRTSCFPSDALKGRLREFPYRHRVAEAFVLEDALTFYFEALSDEEILARLNTTKKAAMRRPRSSTT